MTDLFATKTLKHITSEIFFLQFTCISYHIFKEEVIIALYLDLVLMFFDTPVAFILLFTESSFLRK